MRVFALIGGVHVVFVLASVSVCVEGFVMVPDNAYFAHPIGITSTRPTSAITTRRRPLRRRSLHVLQESLVADISTAFTYSLTHYQLATESVTAAVLAGVGDIMAQQLPGLKPDNNHNNNDSSYARDGPVIHENGKHTTHNWDWRRTRIFVLKGSVSGILWSQWYAFCDPFSMEIAQHINNVIVQQQQHPLFPILNSIGDEHNTLQLLPLQIGISIVLEQFIWCPFIYSVWDIPFPMLLRGDPIEDMPARVKATLPPLLWENCKVWTPANIIIYQIPLQWRVVLVSLTDVLWQSILSSALSSSAPPISSSSSASTSLSLMSSLDETHVTKDTVLSLTQLSPLTTNLRNNDTIPMEILSATQTVQP